jgi:hypothetical protein
MTAAEVPAWSTPKQDRRAAYLLSAVCVLIIAAAPMLGLSSFLQSLVIEVLTFSTSP